MAEIYLGTIVLEPNRWSSLRQDQRATIRASEWLDGAASAGFDGIELWEPHLAEADPAEVSAVLGHPIGITVYNSYVGFDAPDDTARRDAAAWVRRSGATRVKWNTGADRDAAALGLYAERAARWADEMPGVRLICECHDGSAMDDPAAAARVLTAAGSADRVQALVHTHDEADVLRAKFAAYGDRITHAHINHLPAGQPPLADWRDEFAATTSLLADLGFTGTWTIEFVHGLGTEADEPVRMLEQAVADLGVAREILA